ncbi:fatty acid desaturase [Chromatiales bacterium (ex Bugula neritina AB1)]|nr:fatty acid desaturase [Chromatiales bacterium (ex Bugula neritina AB1)]
MDHRSFIQSLSSGQRQALTRKSNSAALQRLALHWGAIVLTGWLIVERVVLWPLLLVLQGVLIIFLFTLLHETIHRTAFATRAANDRVAFVCGFLVILCPQWFRYFHFEHHRFTQHPHKDPELATPKPVTRWQYAKHLSGIPVWLGQLRVLLGNATGASRSAYIPGGGSIIVQREARLFISGYVLLMVISVWLSTTVLLYVWLLPVLLGQPFLRFYLLAEHANCAMVENMFVNTRTTFTSSLVRLITWNMPYHAEHHAYPAVPFHRLEQLHKLMRNYLQETEQGYLAFNKKYIQSLSSKR